MNKQGGTELNPLEQSQVNDYYQVGGSLSSDQQSYVSRQADEDLLRFLMAGFFCYVLTSRQTGKSSLRVRTIDRLKQQDVVCATIDITSIGSEMSTAEQWYFSLLFKLTRECEIQIDLQAWWKKRGLLTYVNRFSEFIESVLLQKIDKPITIFIDEIDSLLSLDREQFSTDDFFAAIRAFYNARVDNPQFNRLTFALFGVAAPDDLMRDPARTPFNIGQAIELTYFTPSEVEPLARGLANSIAEADAILHDILYWTNGQPYLTQKLCREMVASNVNRENTSLKKRVQQLFFSQSGLDDPNIANIDQRILAEQKYNSRMLELYQAILTNGYIKADDRDEAQVYLKLSGLVMSNQSNELVVSNRIYQQVFDLEWIYRTRTKINRLFIADLDRWLESGKSSAALLRGDILEQAIQWANQRNDLTHKEKDYLEASRSHEIEQAKAFANQQRKVANRLRMMNVALYFVFFLAVAAAIVAWNLRGLADTKAHEAVTARDQAEKQRQRAEIEQSRAQQEAQAAQEARALAEQQMQIAAEQKKQADKAKIRAQNFAATEKQARAEAEIAKRIAEKASARASRSELARTENLFFSQITHSALLARTGEFAKAKKILKESEKFGSKVPEELRHSRRLMSWYARLFSGKAERVYKTQNVPLNTVALSPDGTQFIIAGQNNTVVLTDASTGKAIRSFKEHTDSVDKAVFLPDGKHFVSAGKDGRVILWSLTEGLVRQWNLTGEVWALAISSDGRMIAVGGTDKIITLINLASGEVSGILAGHSNYISAVAFATSLGKAVLASSSYDGTARIWDINTGEVLTKLVGHSAEINDVVFQPNDKLIATSSADKTVRIWRVDSGEPVRVLSGHDNIVFALLFSQSGDRLVSSSQDHTIRLWDVSSGETIGVFEGHTGTPLGLAMHGDNLYSAAGDGSLRFWHLNIDKGVVLKKLLQGKLIASAISPDLSKVVVGFEEGKIQLYSVPELNLIWEQAKAHNDTVGRLVFSPDGQSIASVSLDNRLKLWNVVSGKKILETAGSGGNIFSAAFIPGRRQLVMTGNDGKIGVIDIENKSRQFYPVHKGSVYSVFPSQNGEKLLTAGEDGEIKLWQFTSGSLKLVKRFLDNVDSVYWAALSPDQKYITSGGRDARLRVFELNQTHPVQILTGHENSIYKTIFSPDGRHVATVSIDMTIRFWDLTTHSQLFTLSVSNPSQQIWDFDFRCHTVDGSNACLLAAPLPSGLLKLYRIGNIYH